ncbi:hypothetical protein Moror_7373 [Moniliophthora roreri MCA 2997]|uniref:Mediator of RNA polymerase II transcription subunit 20 n=2 Tax=Moniliophthora roreri TaxID=221103 RepID=V2XA08_MONRO|nr:hypothetical protein Moror_7373 [Moniliophthora roreri MCA 2997]KAI3612151.1 hypothetical protein WG66_012131 [Moniliophthora roreri]
MGFTGLARWLNAPASGLQLITDNIIRNHNGVYRGKWYLTVKSFRSALGQIPGFQIPAERVMCALTMNDKVFVLLDDPLAPSRRDIISDFQPTHYHHTFLTLSPPGALEQLLSQLKARWIPVRQSNPTQRGQTSGSNLVIDGHVFNIGNDWIVRVGNVILAGGAVKGMILEAEYLPLPTLNSPTPDGTSELLSNLLISVLPNVKDAKTLAITLSDAQWEDFESDRDEDDKWVEQKPQSDGKEKPSDGIHFYGDEEEPSAPRENDWTGVERDRRSAYLIIGFLRTETIL